MNNEQFNELFFNCIKEAIKSVKLITGTDMNYKKAQVYTSIANALALTGKINTDKAATNEVEQTETLKKGSEDKMRDPNVDCFTGTISSKKNTASSLKPKTMEAVEKENEESMEDTAEWTKAMESKYKSELNKIKDYQNKFSVKFIDNLLSDYTGGVYKDVETGIKPLNIKGFIAYLESYKESFDVIYSVKTEYGEDALNDCIKMAYEDSNVKRETLDDVPVDEIIDLSKLLLSLMQEEEGSEQAS